MTIRQKISLTPALFALYLAGRAEATPVTGSANIAGNVTVSASSILFSPTFTNAGAGTETGSFTGLTDGTIQSLTGGPATGNVFIPNFITFSGGTAAPIIFDLTYIAPGVGTVAACASAIPGAKCTPAGSPFTLFQLTSNTVIAALQLNGNSYIGSSGTGQTPTITSGIFSSQTVAQGTVPQIAALFASGQSISGITYSASFATNNVVPEPAPLGLVGLALVAAGILTRRRLSRP